MKYGQYEPVIGLEVHVQLQTKSKIFSSAPNRFGDEPNTNISEVCTGQPGALPVLNKEAVRLAVLFGLAVNAKIAPVSIFERKSYFYPDSPRNFQITQMDYPIIVGGTIIAAIDGETKSFTLNRAHLEDDAGMLKHFSTFAGVDYNRAGVPLLEVVSEPMIHTTKDAIAYLTALKAIALYIGASDCNMEEGSLRVDGNVSVRKKGETTLRPKTEIKNMNSFSMLEMAMEAEISRQIDLYEKHPTLPHNEVITSGTYRWDPVKKQTILMRKKEAQNDYRYFPEPDLLPLTLSPDYIEEVRKTLPELPHERYKRYVEQLELSEYAAGTLINDKPLADFFEEGLKHTSNARSLCNWITVEFVGRCKEKEISLFDLNISAEHIAHLVNLIDEKTITGKIAKAVADDMMQQPQKDPIQLVKENPDYLPVSDNASVEKFIIQAMDENPQSVDDYRAGKTKAFAYLVGQVMKLSKGKCSPQLLNELLRNKLEGK